MNTTITVTMPNELKQSLQAQVAAGQFRSLSAVVRTAAKRYVQAKQKLTVNGFTKKFEDQILKASREPVGTGQILETDEDVNKYFTGLRKKYEDK